MAKGNVKVGGKSAKYVFSDGSSFKWSDVVWNSNGVSYNSSTMIPIVVGFKHSFGGGGYTTTRTMILKYNNVEIWGGTLTCHMTGGGTLGFNGTNTRLFIPSYFSKLADITGKSFSYNNSQGGSLSPSVYAYVPR